MALVTPEVYLKTFKNRKLGELSCLKYSKIFPVTESSELAIIVGKITTDGYLGRGILQYISKQRKEVISFNNLVSKIFGIKGIIRKSPSNSKVWECLICRNILSKLLELAGAPKGEKVLIRFEVPKWILRGDKEIKIKYLQALFDCEGSVILQKKRRIRIKFGMYKTTPLKKDLIKFLNQIRNMLKEFDIKTTNLTFSGFTKRKDGKISIGLEFEILGTRRNLRAIINFKKKIDFNDPIKLNKLNTYINTVNSINSPPDQASPRL